MTLIFFDTETTGLPLDYKASPVSRSDMWPNIVELAWVVCSPTGEVIKEADYLIKPSLYQTVSAKITEITGITQEDVISEGKDVVEVIEEFLVDFNLAHRAIAHNVSFDVKVLVAELVKLKKHEYKHLLKKPYTCTMNDSTEFCKLPGKFDSYKWPKLEELYEILFKEPFVGAHRALTDVKAELRCYFELKKLGIIND